MIVIRISNILKKKIRPAIKVRNNSISLPVNNKIRNREDISHRRDFLLWKKKRKCGYGWMTETAFSSIKRMFGEYASTTRYQIGKRDGNEDIVVQPV